MSAENIVVSGEMLDEEVDKSPRPRCKLARLSSEENREETEFLLSIPRGGCRRYSDASSRDGNDDLSTRVEVESLPGMDQAELAAMEEQIGMDNDTASHVPVVTEPTADAGEAVPRRCSNFNCSIVCEAIPADNMASDSYLKDYYDQLPSETAEYTAGELGDLLGPAPVEPDDGADILQPEVLLSQNPFESAPSIGIGDNFVSELNQGGHPSFKPAPASSFEPEPVETITEEPELVPVETNLVSNSPVFIEEGKT